ncbi:MAG: hypothetical protein RLZZ306_2708 [Bacteroidota bacterium]
MGNIFPKKMIIREIFKNIQEKMGKGKAIIILGARQIGKTTLVKSLLPINPIDGLFLDADNVEVQEILANANLERLKNIIGKATVVIIDEAQRIPNIGLSLKLVTDNLPHVQLLVTGSSSLELANLTNEPLTGRKWEYQMFPISWQELQNHFGYMNAHLQLENRLIFGMYPEIITHLGEERERLSALSQSYLYKDILSLGRIRKPEFLQKLLKALAFQVGNEVSLNELAQLTGIDKATVGTYLDLLEKSFVIFRLQALSRNLRNEISATRKIYFHDNGIRNALINNFAPLSLRQDVGALWENFLISERLKANHYQKKSVNCYFWRTKSQQEIDYIEEIDGQFTAFEFKWKLHKKVKIPTSFSEAYHPQDFKIITKDDFDGFL